MSKQLNIALATAIGVIVANLYYAQPLVGIISKSLGLPTEKAGLVVTLTQMGYGIGVLLIVPLGDIVQNRKLILSNIVLTIFGVLGLAFSKSLVPYFMAAFLTGLGASAVQIIVPFAAGISPEEKRGAVVGSLMSGLMMGIMLSRPVAGVMTDLISWHAVFVLSACLMVLICVMLYRVLPAHEAHNKNLHYFTLLKSMIELYLTIPELRRRSIYQGLLFGSFCLFWTACPLYLEGPLFHLSHTAIAIFALVGVAGAIAAPFAGRAADKGWIWGATLFAIGLCAFAFVISHIFPEGSMLALAAMVIAAILLDAGVTANLVLGQRVIFSLAPHYRNRLNGLFIATIFVGGATGSALGTWAYAHGGWQWASWAGFLMPITGLLFFLTEKKRKK